METKKPTNAQLQRRLQNAVVLVEKTKDTQSIYLSDKGLRLTTTDDYAVIETGYHRHVFSKVSGMGISRPYLYTQRVIEIANENKDNIRTESGYSFAKLLEVLKANENQAEYNITVYWEWWAFNCFQPLFSIGESDVESFLVYETYLHNIARNSVILSEKKEDMTDKQFIDKVIKNMQEFTGHNEPRIIFTKKTDGELMKEEMDAITANEQEQAMDVQQENEHQRYINSYSVLTDRGRDYIIGAQKDLNFDKNLQVFGKNDGKKVCVKVYDVGDGWHYSSEQDIAYLYIDSKYLTIHDKESEISLDSIIKLTDEGREFVKKECGISHNYFDVMLHSGFLEMNETMEVQDGNKD